MSDKCQEVFLDNEQSLHTFAIKNSKRMKRLLFLPLLAAMIAVHAQDVKEGETLQEVTVKGSKVVQRVDGQTIYPTRQQLESSTNGYSLLSKLTLPHLRIDPVMHTITALSNLGSVQVRINDIVASKEDLLALDMKAVQHIDYIDNPGVRYGEGVAYVVNIIVKKPVSGYDIGADLTNTLTAVNGDETVLMRPSMGSSTMERASLERTTLSATKTSRGRNMKNRRHTNWSPVRNEAFCAGNQMGKTKVSTITSN